MNFSKAELQALTPEERTVLEALLGKLPDIKKPVIPRTKLAEYYVLKKATCRLCDTVEARYFYMQWSDELGALKSVLQPPDFVLTYTKENASRVIEKQITLHKCSHCEEVLGQLSKEELIAKLLCLAPVMM